MDEALKQLFSLGRGFFEKKQYAEAEKYLSQIIEQNQSFADVYNMLGVAYHDMGQGGRAQRAFEAALRINPRYTEAALNLAVVYNDLGKYSAAREVYEAALARERSPPGELDGVIRRKIANMYADIGDVFSACGRHQQAADEYRHALALGPTFVDVRLKLAGALRDLGALEQSLGEVDQVLAQNPDYVPALVHRGLVLHALGQWGDAASAWESVLARSPGHRAAELYLSLERRPSP
ncbi:MAG: tetratricopeptide repeat protein [Myxococcaceae bacterium]